MYTHQEKDGMIKVMWLACFNSIHYKLLHKNYEDLKKKCKQNVSLEAGRNIELRATLPLVAMRVLMVFSPIHFNG